MSKEEIRIRCRKRAEKDIGKGCTQLGHTIEEIEEALFNYYSKHQDQVDELEGKIGKEKEGRQIELISIKGDHKTIVLEGDHLQGEKNSYKNYKFNPIPSNTRRSRSLLELSYLIIVLKKNKINFMMLSPKTQRELVTFLIDIPRRKLKLKSRSSVVGDETPRYYGFYSKVDSYVNLLVLMQIPIKDEVLDKIISMIPELERTRKRKERENLTKRENDGEPLLA